MEALSSAKSASILIGCTEIMSDAKRNAWSVRKRAIARKAYDYKEAR
jgi:hypothetical protein